MGAALYQVIEELQATHPDRVVEVEFSLTEIVYCDRARIAQLFSNLLGNAMTHGPRTSRLRCAPQRAPTSSNYQWQMEASRSLRQRWSASLSHFFAAPFDQASKGWGLAFT